MIERLKLVSKSILSSTIKLIILTCEKDPEEGKQSILTQLFLDIVKEFTTESPDSLLGEIVIDSINELLQ